MTQTLFSAAVLTLFPDMFPGPLGQSLAGTALKKNLWSLEAIDIRQFATDRHRTVDDSPYGGGTGMVLKPDIVDTAVGYAMARVPNPRLIYTSPRGVPFTQSLAEELKTASPVILCGRFEGVDQRVIEHHDMLEVSLGDFVLSGGEIAALAMLDAIVRLLPGVIGKESALAEESFSMKNQQIFPPTDESFAGLLEYPHYTRPSLWKGRSVPDILLSGNHEQIQQWRLAQSREVTAKRRPDLIRKSSTKE